VAIFPEEAMSPPAPPVCLIRPYSATGQRGGTLIAEDIVDPEEHRRRLWDPDGYRPPRCLHCGHDRLHAHDFRERQRRGESQWERFRRYRCAGCRAVWLVLAAFVARHLHRSWSFVQAAAGVEDTESARPSRATRPVPAATLRRWLRRLQSGAAVVVQAFGTSGVALGRAAEAASRAEVLAAMVVEKLLSAGRAMAELAGWLHRLVPGLRLL
jgi:transposase-like protein